MINIFQANLFHKENVGTPESRDSLLKQIKTLQGFNPDTTDTTNSGCWRTEEDLQDADWVYKEVIGLLDQAVVHYKKEDVIFNRHNQVKKCKIHSWINVNKPYSRNVLHSHTQSHFSCVYYIQGSNTGNLRLINPANLLGNCNKSAPFVRDLIFSPSDGDLILWPAWVPHEVEPNMSSRERINMVFDITLGDE